MISYIKERVHEFERSHGLETLFTPKTTNLCVGISGFMDGKVMQYSLFDNKIKKDTVRKVMYQIKDHFDHKNVIRKGCELFIPDVMKDAIGFGSVRDMSPNGLEIRNKHLLEEEGVPRPLPKRKPEPVPKEEDPYSDLQFDNEAIWQYDNGMA